MSKIEYLVESRVVVFLAESVPSVRGSSQEQTRLGIILCSGPFDFRKKRFDLMKRKKGFEIEKRKAQARHNTVLRSI